MEKTISRKKAHICKLNYEYRSKINTETISKLAKTRPQLANKCAEYAVFCVEQSTAPHHRKFHLDAAIVATNGISMDPFNSACYDILIKMFSEEKESAEAAINNGQYEHIEEETLLKHLVEEDIQDGWAKNLVFRDGEWKLSVDEFFFHKAGIFKIFH